MRVFALLLVALSLEAAGLDKQFKLNDAYLRDKKEHKDTNDGLLDDAFKDLQIGGEIRYRYDKQKTNSKALKREKKPSLKGTLDLMLPLNAGD